MRTARLTLRSVLPGTGKTARAVFNYAADKQAVSVVRVDPDAMKTLGRRIAKPDAEARWLMAVNGKRRLDTIDGWATFGDVWALDHGFVKAQLGDGHDFGFSSRNADGSGWRLRAAGNTLILKPGDYTGILPFITMTRKIDGIELVNGVLIVHGNIEALQQPHRIEWGPDREIHHSIAFGAATSGNDTDGGDDVSFAGPNVTGSDTLLVAGIGSSGGTPQLTTSALWNGSATGHAELFDFTGESFFHISMHRFVAPAAGAQTFSAQTAGSQDFGVSAAVGFFTGIDQGSPTGTKGTDTAQGTGAPSVNVTNATGGVAVVNCLVFAGTLTHDGGQTLIDEEENVFGLYSQGMSYKAGNGAQTLSYSDPGSSSLINAVPMNEAGAAAETITPDKWLGQSRLVRKRKEVVTFR